VFLQPGLLAAPALVFFDVAGVEGVLRVEPARGVDHEAASSHEVADGGGGNAGHFGEFRLENVHCGKATAPAINRLLTGAKKINPNQKQAHGSKNAARRIDCNRGIGADRTRFSPAPFPSGRGRGGHGESRNGMLPQNLVRISAFIFFKNLYFF